MSKKSLSRCVVFMCLIVTLLSIHVHCQTPLLSQQSLTPYFIVGNQVNVREEPSLNAPVEFQANWGECYKAISTHKDWVEVLSYDEYRHYFIHSSYCVPVDTFLTLAQAQSKKSAQTYYWMIELLYKPKLLGDMESELLLLETLGTDIESEIIVGFEHCLNVKYHAYQLLVESYYDKLDQLPLLQAPYRDNLLMGIWYKLDLAKYYARQNKLSQSIMLIEEVLHYPSNYFFLVDCEYSWDYRSYPLTELRRTSLAIYELATSLQQQNFIGLLAKVEESQKDPLMKDTIEEIIGKMRNQAW